MAQLSRVVRELSVLGTVGAATMAVARSVFFQSAPPDALISQTVFLKNEKQLIAPLQLFRPVASEREFQRVVQECDDFLHLIYTTSVRGRQFKANRAISSVMTICNRLIHDAKESRNFEQIDAAIICQKDAVPSLEATMHSILQNMLMA